MIELIYKELAKDCVRGFRTRMLPKGMLRGNFHFGYCPICETRTIFIRRDEWLRDYYHCIRCCSIPRWRALIHVLQMYFPDWRKKRIHESSPGGSSSEKLKQECHYYIATHFFPDTKCGEMKNGYRCENLERQTFDDESFDLAVTQDVLEHVLNPGPALREIARTLKPGGAHVFTVPWYSGKETLIRAVQENNQIRHLAEPEYHGNPIDASGSLVVTEWGWDLCDFIYRNSGLTTTVIRITDRYRGIDGEFREVFISRKHSIPK